MFSETTKLQDDLLDDGADCVIALPPSPKRARSRFQATLLQIMVIFTALIKPKQSPSIKIC